MVHRSYEQELKSDASASAYKARTLLERMLDQAEQVFAPAVALRVDPNAPVGEDPYADPQYQVPDDLVW